MFAGALALAEWLRGHVFTGFPWDLPGETWRAGSAPSQLASVLGAYGLTWVTLAIAAAPGLGWRGRDARIALGAAVVGLAALYGFGAWRLDHAVTGPAPGAPLIRIVQPDTPERASYDAAAFAEVANRNLTLTRAPAARAPDIVIWSEAGLPDAVEDYLAPGTWTAAAIAASLRPGETLITGGYRAQPAPPGAFAPDGNLYFNTLVAVQRGPSGLTVTAGYDKHRLIPFGEYLPLARLAERARRAAAGPRRPGLHARPAAAADRAARRAARATADLLREPVSRLHPRRRAPRRFPRPAGSSTSPTTPGSGSPAAPGST